MDVKDVSDMGQYRQLLEGQKNMLKAAEVRKGQLATGGKPRQEILDKFNMMQLQIMMRKNLQTGKQEYLIHSSFVPPTYLPCVAALAMLRPVHIRDLRIATYHRGRYLIARSLTDSQVMTAIMAVVEDEKGDAILLQLYQQPRENDRPPSAIISKDVVFILKEPYLKIMGDGDFGLRVDHVSDILRINPDHELYPARWKRSVATASKTADQWKREGNMAIECGQPWLAIEKYTKALQSNPSPDEATVIRLNRALAYLRDQNYEAALHDTRYGKADIDQNEKAMYRTGLALYGLARYEEAGKIWQKMSTVFPRNRSAAAELKRTQARLEERKTGNYPIRKMYNEIASLPQPHLDYATYSGPVIVKESPGRGRGLFTTRLVKAGELLLCEKAFAHAFVDVSEKATALCSRTSLLINTSTNRMTLGAQADLITIVVQKLLRNTVLAKAFKEMHHGNYEVAEADEVDGVPVVDTFLVEKVVSLNVFGCPLSSQSSHFNEQKEGETQHHSCGLWFKASLINHACHKNADRSFIGDMQFVHAACDIPADTEVTFWYQQPTGDHKYMEGKTESWDFQCGCVICEESRHLSKNVFKKRHGFLSDLQVTLTGRRLDANKVERLVASIEQTYKHSAAQVPRLALRDPYFKLAAHYSKLRQPEKSVAMALKALEALGFVIKDGHLPVSGGTDFVVEQWGIVTNDVVDLWIIICTAYVTFAPHMLRHAAKCAKLAYKMCVGEDETFRERYDKEGDLPI